jgi:hypothetical protein
MFSEIQKGIGDFLGSRFILTILIPILLFNFLITILVASCFSFTDTISFWDSLSSLCHFIIIFFFLGINLFQSFIFSGVLGSILRLYEGYGWESFPFGKRLANLGIIYHKNIIFNLSDSCKKTEEQLNKDYFKIYMNYPPSTRMENVMPTLIGNRLKNLELYPLLRYQIDAVIIWPRLFAVLPDRLLQNIGVAKSKIDFMLAVSFLSLLFSFVGGCISLFLSPFYVFTICFGGGLIFTWIGYQGLVYVSGTYCELIKVAFDLHRNTLLKAIDFDIPTSLKQDRDRWSYISQLWYKGAPSTEGWQMLGYKQKSTPTESDQ